MSITYNVCQEYNLNTVQRTRIVLIGRGLLVEWILRLRMGGAQISGCRGLKLNKTCGMIRLWRYWWRWLDAAGWKTLLFSYPDIQYTLSITWCTIHFGITAVSCSEWVGTAISHQYIMGHFGIKLSTQSTALVIVIQITTTTTKYIKKETTLTRWQTGYIKKSMQIHKHKRT